MIVVIGGGAAGMVAAIQARKMGADVVLIEKNHDCGKKLRITGKGRCNVTNACPTEEIFDHIPKNPRFLYSAIYSFSNFDCMDFFEELGVPLKTERGNRVFPVSDNAKDIVGALVSKMHELGVKIVNTTAVSIKTKDNCVCGVETKKGAYFCDKVIVATGGASYPKTGSTGDGYKMLEKIGHTIVKVTPSLVPLCLAEDTQMLMGLSLKNVRLSATKGKKTVYDEMGEMLFTHYGVSGPLVLSASSHMGDAPKDIKLHIDLKPALDEKTLENRLLRDFLKYQNKNFENSLSDLLPKKMAEYIVKRSGIDPYLKVNSLTKENRRTLLNLMKNLEFTVSGYRPVDEAIVTSGGINVKEINSSTMESRIVNGLYIAGELIDVSAYTGGFNLQIAFSTGYLAAESAVEKENII